MIKDQVSVEINRPLEEVSGFVSDMENMQQWVGEVNEVKKTSAGPVGVGTTYTTTAKILGRRIEATQEVTDYEPNKKLSWKSTSGPIPSQLGITSESVGGGTKVTVAIQGDVGGFFKLAEPIVHRIMKRQWENSIATLKDLLESQA